MTGRERLLAAALGEPVDATPVWFMRQAGGRLARYTSLRARHGVLEIAKTPALCAEVTVAAVEELGVDGAVLFADIMLLAEALGINVELTPAGPVIAAPVRSRTDVERLRSVDPDADLGFVLEAIRRVRTALGERAAVIGLVGGPFTLAAYLLEGAPSRDQVHARAVMHGAPDVWHALLARIAAATTAYLRAQAAAGADVVQVFDTWAGSLTPDEYAAFVAPYARQVVAGAPVPTVQYVARSSALLETIAADGATVIGIDSRQSLAAARDRLGRARPVQGNLDPALVLAGSAAARAGARRVLDEAGAVGHLLNLGEAAPRDADPEVLRDLVSFVHEVSAREGSAWTAQPVGAGR
ncbi:MAG TPA: uroporphyrinogen decarboxylase [Candidatus Limnocylindrales bacterium]|nr:uroporphyrinogen decarboxylase [Candidatus Limnocylindrales bacterium]